MRIIYQPHEVHAQVAFARNEGRTIGLVPSMGALHQGHLSLVEIARQQCDLTVATIFVNPTQFGPQEDFGKYPRTLDSDLEMLARAGTDIVFVPAAECIYPEGFSTYVAPPAIARRWEGEIRPTHFQGVTTVVLKLFNMIPATIAFFGQKDLQQCRVIQRMVEDLNVPIRIEICPTVREADGLAMSSRNRYLSGDERQRALGLWRAIQKAQELVNQGEKKVSTIEQAMQMCLIDAGVSSIDYARMVDAVMLEPIQTIHQSAACIIAVRMGTTRLIDNAFIEVP
jgi:pantoate--beta-alanine ligase